MRAVALAAALAVALALPPTAAADGHVHRGYASWVRPSLGRAYIAARMPRGTRVRICGHHGCTRGRVTDYGPSRRRFPSRITDLSAYRFRIVCGRLSMGTCRVRMWVLP